MDYEPPPPVLPEYDIPPTALKYSNKQYQQSSVDHFAGCCLAEGKSNYRIAPRINWFSLQLKALGFL